MQHYLLHVNVNSNVYFDPFPFFKGSNGEYIKDIFFPNHGLSSLFMPQTPFLPALSIYYSILSAGSVFPAFPYFWKTYRYTPLLKNASAIDPAITTTDRALITGDTPNRIME